MDAREGRGTGPALAVREWATGILEDPRVQARLLADARAGDTPSIGPHGVDDLRHEELKRLVPID